MGAYASNFQADNGGSVASFTSPDEPNWITAHAIASGLAIPEVERLWNRFQQIGCDQDGLLSLTEPLSPEISQDAFVKNILKSMKGTDDKISFHSFLVSLKWIVCESIDKKVRATFHLLNNGKPIDETLLRKILQRVYPEDSEATVRRLAGVFFSEMDKDQNGYIREDQFINWVRRMPEETVAQLMDFRILPSDISQEAHEQLSEFRGSDLMTSRPGISGTTSANLPSDDILEEVAEKICRRDWVLVGGKLGLVQQDLDYILHKFDGDSKQQAYQMLIDWKRKSGTSARLEMLDKALRSSSMTDAALILPTH